MLLQVLHGKKKLKIYELKGGHYRKEAICILIIYKILAGRERDKEDVIANIDYQHSSNTTNKSFSL